MTIEIDIKLQIEPILAAINEGARDGLEFIADLIAVEARAMAPVGKVQGPTARTGNLKSSIRAGRVEGDFLDGSLRGSVLAAAPYAAFVEFGTLSRGEPGFASGGTKEIVPTRRKALRFAAPGGDGFIFRKRVTMKGMKSRPYMRPAVEKNLSRIEDKMAAAMELALDKLE